MKKFKHLLLSVFLITISTYAYCQQWITVSPPGYCISDVSFATEKQGWFLARDTSMFQQYSLIGTQNGGEKWDTICNFPNDTKIEMMQMVDSLHGFIKLYRYPDLNIYKRTSDGGYTWENGGPLTPCAAYFFINADTGFYDSGMHLYRTSDGGLNWNEVAFSFDPDTTTPEIENYALWDIYFVDDLHGWLGAVYGYTRTFIHYTNDGGTNWQLIDDYGGDIKFENFVDTLHGAFFLSTDYHSNAGSTSDNFLTLNNIYSDGEVNTIGMQDDSTLWIGFFNHNQILRTKNYGLTFDTLVPVGFENTPFKIWNFKFFGSTGYACGSYIFKYVDTLNTTLHQIPFVEQKISLYPNPSYGSINLTISSQKDETVVLQVYSPDGRSVWKKSEKVIAGENNLHYSFDRLKPGFYIMEIAGARYVTSQKFILRR